MLKEVFAERRSTDSLLVHKAGTDGGCFSIVPLSICLNLLPGSVLPWRSPAFANWPLDAGSTDSSSQNQPSHFYSTLPFFFLKKILAAASGMWDPSSPTRDLTCTPGVGRQSFNHWTAREVPTWWMVTKDDAPVAPDGTRIWHF